MDENNLSIIKRITSYFVAPDEFEQMHSSYSRKKGLLILGYPGQGKTSHFKALNAISQQNRGNDAFRFITNHEINKMVRSGREEAIASLSDEDYEFEFEYRGADRFRRKTFPHAMYIDDLMDQPWIVEYGERMSPTLQLLTARYNCWVEDGMITHASCCDSLSSLKKKAGQKVYDRMIEMFNIVPYSPKARNWRAL